MWWFEDYGPSPSPNAMAKDMFGVNDFHIITRMWIPPEVESSVELFSTIANHIERSAAPATGATDAVHGSDSMADLLFSDVKVDSKHSIYGAFHSPILVRISANLTNTSRMSITKNDVPSIYCSETKDLIRCTMETNELGPGESMQVAFNLIVRDAFSGWLLFQSASNPQTQRLIFAGLDGLTTLIRSLIQREIDNERPLLEELVSHMDDKEMADRLINKWLMVADNGECFHSDWACGNSYQTSFIRIRDAYKAGYRPCLKCVGDDWWRRGWFEDPEGDNFWLTSASGILVAAWSKDSYPSCEPADIYV